MRAVRGRGKRGPHVGTREAPVSVRETCLAQADSPGLHGVIHRETVELSAEFARALAQRRLVALLGAAGHGFGRVVLRLLVQETGLRVGEGDGARDEKPECIRYGTFLRKSQ